MTRDEITAVVDVTQDPAGSVVDYGSPIQTSDTPIDAAGKAYMRFFNDRYQVFGRRVHLYGFNGSTTTQNGQGPQQAQAEVGQIDSRLHPFAIAMATDPTPGISPYLPETARRGIVSAAYGAHARRSYRSIDPLYYSFLLDYEDEPCLPT